MDLETSTTQEIFEELQKRSHTVVLLCAKILDKDRIEIFQQSSGSWALLYGMIVERLLRDATADILTRFGEGDRDGGVSDDSL